MSKKYEYKYQIIEMKGNTSPSGGNYSYHPGPSTWKVGYRRELKDRKNNSHMWVIISEKNI